VAFGQTGEAPLVEALRRADALIASLIAIEEEKNCRPHRFQRSRHRRLSRGAKWEI
jgi:hypothetical protein